MRLVQKSFRNLIIESDLEEGVRPEYRRREVILDRRKDVFKHWESQKHRVCLKTHKENASDWSPECILQMGREGVPGKEAKKAGMAGQGKPLAAMLKKFGLQPISWE